MGKAGAVVRSHSEAQSESGVTNAGRGGGAAVFPLPRAGLLGVALRSPPGPLSDEAAAPGRGEE